MSDDLILPPEARLDPRRGQRGGHVTSSSPARICGREVRHPTPVGIALD